MSENDAIPLVKVAEILNVSDYTVMSWAEEGGLETAGSPFLFTAESVESLKAQLLERKQTSRDLMTDFHGEAGL